MLRDGRFQLKFKDNQENAGIETSRCRFAKGQGLNEKSVCKIKHENLLHFMHNKMFTIVRRIVRRIRRIQTSAQGEQNIKRVRHAKSSSVNFVLR